MRKIPVFVSSPTELNPEQEKKRNIIIRILNDMQMEPRSLGRSDYPKNYPLKEVYVIAKHCSGGVILGFEQILVKTGIRKQGTLAEEKITAGSKKVSIPTPWNHLEAGILFSLKIPMLVFKESGVEGGVFDYGITDVFVHYMPPANPSKAKLEELKQVFLSWQGDVSQKYYEYR